MGSSVSSVGVAHPCCSRWGPAAVLIGVGVMGVFAVAADLRFRGWLERCDRPIQFYFHQHAGYAWVMLFAAVSGLGQSAFLVPFTAIIELALLVQRRWRAAFVWAVALIGAAFLNAALKALFHVPRPDRFTFYVFPTDSGFSFPSGHTMGVSIAAGALALVLLHNSPASRARAWMAFAVVAAMSLLEAFALLYLGVHYLTDVLGVLAVSAAWLGVIRWMLPPEKIDSEK